MTKSLILGTILGGLAAFVWSSISWELIGWHEKTMVAFHNEDEVSAVIASHAGQDGTFILPGVPSTAGMTPEQKKAALDAVMQKMQTGPIMVAAVRRGGFGSYTHGLIVQLFSLMAAAFLLTWLLLQTTGLSYPRRVAFLAVVGLVGQRNRRSPQLELVGLLRRLHRREPRRFHAHVAIRRPDHRQSR